MKDEYFSLEEIVEYLNKLAKDIERSRKFQYAFLGSIKDEDFKEDNLKDFISLYGKNTACIEIAKFLNGKLNDERINEYKRQMEESGEIYLNGILNIINIYRNRRR